MLDSVTGADKPEECLLSSLEKILWLDVLPDANQFTESTESISGSKVINNFQDKILQLR